MDVSADLAHQRIIKAWSSSYE